MSSEDDNDLAPVEQELGGEPELDLQQNELVQILQMQQPSEVQEVQVVDVEAPENEEEFKQEVSSEHKVSWQMPDLSLVVDKSDLEDD